MGDTPAVISRAMRFGTLLGQTAALNGRVLDRSLTPLGITAAQLKVLKIIRRGDDTAVVLCKHLSIHSASMTRMLDRLERKGLIARSREHHDRRQVRLALTNKGEALSAVLPAFEVAALNEFTAGLTAEELSQLELLLKKMLASR